VAKEGITIDAPMKQAPDRSEGSGATCEPPGGWSGNVPSKQWVAPATHGNAPKWTQEPKTTKSRDQ